MMAKLRTLLWYVALLLLLLALWHVGASFRVAVVDEGFKSMVPTIEPRGIYFLDRRKSTLFSLTPDDILAFRLLDRNLDSRRIFGRVLATPGMTVSVRKGRLLVDAGDVSMMPPGLEVLSSGLIVPRDTVFVVFDSARRGDLTLSQRLVPYRDVIGRVMGK